MKAKSNLFQFGCALTLAVVIALGSAATAQAQSIAANATLGSVPSGGSFNYTITLNNTGGSTSPIGTFWYGWVPGLFFLPTTPTGIINPSGWTGVVEGNASIEWTANSSASYLQPGSSLNFGFTSTSTPAVMNGPASNPTYQVGTSLLYAAGAFSSPQEQFNVAPVPEPSSLALLAMGALGCVGGAWRKLRAR